MVRCSMRGDGSLLIKCTHFRSLNINSLIQVYEQSLGDVTWHTVNAFSEDLQLFFRCNRAFVAQWVVHDAPVAAVRIEPYRDGYLITCLETAPQCRRMGYAAALMCAVMEDTPGVYYAHVDKRNRASLRLHEKLGFRVFLDHAVHVDGSVFTNSFTLKK